MSNFDATVSDRLALEEAYAGRKPYHGELHDHTNSGGTSDGAVPLADYKTEMLAKHMDFAAILDHRQVWHMYLPEFDRNLFICGTEPGTSITDAVAEKKSLHYNMLFPGTGYIEKFLEQFPEYEFTGGIEGHFKYPSFTHEEFGKIIDAVIALGGFFVIPHPKQVMYADDPLQYWFRDWTGLEVFYNDLDCESTRDDYALWVRLLDMDKRIWACAGGDKHEHPDTGALTTIYSDRQYGDAYLPYLKQGDFTAGNAGIRMILGDVRQGGHCAFAGKRLVVAASDYHETVRFADHKYRLCVMDDRGVVCQCDADIDGIACLALDADPSARWYRAEIFDDTTGVRIAVGNPIWNDERA